LSISTETLGTTLPGVRQSGISCQVVCDIRELQIWLI
jgi:hypothetical protein